MPSSYKKIGNYIKEVDLRNTGLKVTNLVGLSISKEFIPSVANTIGSDMESYKIIKKGQFACSTMQVRRDKKMPIALWSYEENAIISQAYSVFEISKNDELLPEYLMMWFSRSEFDREACFHAVGGVRGSLEWDDFLNLKLPIPSIEKQRKIVKEYNIIQQRIELNNQLIQKLEDTAQTLYKHWFVDFEFPNEEGKPYKSSGGKMVYNEELEKEIPEGWKIITVKDFCIEMMNGATPSRFHLEYWNSNDIPWLKTGEISNNIIFEAEEYISTVGYKNSSTKLLPKNTVLMAMYGVTAGQLGFLKFQATTNQACCAMICKNVEYSSFLFYALLKQQSYIESLANGGAQNNLSKAIIEQINLVIPLSEKIIEKIGLNVFIEKIGYYTYQNILFNKTKDLLLSRLAKVE
jgi:type I restriction enzyme S subunit